MIDLPQTMTALSPAGDRWLIGELNASRSCLAAYWSITKHTRFGFEVVILWR